MKHFIKEWGLFLLTITLFGISYLFVWLNVSVDGHSMDPTLAHGEKLFVVRTAKVERFDIVVADEIDEDGSIKKIVKRVIGMPGDTISYNNDTLTINGEVVEEAYLNEFKSLFAKDKLQATYSYSKFFQGLASKAPAFTYDKAGETTFTVTVPENHYYLLGDDRIVSNDSRHEGTFSRDTLVGEVKFRYWPLNRIGTVK